MVSFLSEMGNNPIGAVAAIPTQNSAIDTANIQSTINSVESLGGGMVILWPGTYVIGKLLIPSNITLVGNNTTLQAKNALNDNMIRNKDPLLGNRGMVIRDIHFEGNSANQTPGHNPSHAIGWYNASVSRIDNCTFNDMELDGVYLGRNGAIDGITVGGSNTDIVVMDCTLTNIRRNAISITRGKRCRVLNCTIVNANAGVPDNGLYDAAAIDLEPNEITDDCEDLEVAYCTITSSHAPSIALAGSYGKKRIHLHHNTIYQTDNYGIAVFTPVDGFSADDNEIHCTGAVGIWINGQGENILNVKINRNQIYGNDTALLSGIGIGYVPDNAQVVENRVQDFDRGIYVFTGAIATLTRNTLVSCTNPVVTGGGGVANQTGTIIE